MVRFARSDGSKGSNKKQFEEPTPWAEMVSHLESKKKKGKKKEELVSEKNDEIPEQATKKKKNIDSGEQQTQPQNAFQAVKNQVMDEKKEEEGLPTQAMQNTAKKTKKEKKKGLKSSEPEYTINKEGKRVKVFRDGTERTWFDLPYEESDTMTRYESMWVKKKMVGELDLLKAALEEEGLDKKGIMKKMMKAKRKAHRELRIELIYQQKSLVSEATSEKGDADSNCRGINIKKQNNDTKRTKKKKQKLLMMDNNLCISPNTESNSQTNANKCNVLEENTEEDQVGDDNGTVAEDDTKVTITPPTCDTVQKERKTKDPDRKRKKKNRTEAGRLEATLSQVNVKEAEERQGEKRILTTEGDDKEKDENMSKKVKLETELVSSQINKEDSDGNDMKVTVTPKTDGKKKKMKEATLDTEEKMKEATQETEVAEPQINMMEYNNEVSEAKNIQLFTSLNEETSNCDFNKLDNTSSPQEGFQENELMTNYDGYWVLREEVESLEAAKKMELEAIFAARTDESDTNEGKLTPKEQIVLQRAMKKRKRFQHRKLLQNLPKTGRKVNNAGRGNRGGKREDDSGKVVQFDGFWVKKDAADRLHKLRKNLYKEGLSQQEVDALIQKERRKEERVLKNERKLVCLNCREPGHMVSACPKIVQADGEALPSICYTCGSTEHTSSTCNLQKGSEQSFSFATCYICKETGHISRQCPDNPRGLYPKGGECRGCGSVEHLAKDCPDLQKENAESSIRVGRLKGEELEALDEDADEAVDQDVSSTHSKLDKPKVVTF